MTWKQRPGQPLTLKIDDKVLTDPQKVAESFNKRFANIAEKLLSEQPNALNRDNMPSQDLLQFTDSKLPPGITFEIPLIHRYEGKKVILELDPIQGNWY